MVVTEEYNDNDTVNDDASTINDNDTINGDNDVDIDDEDEYEDEEEEPIVVKLTEEEIRKLEEERKRQEEEIKKKTQKVVKEAKLVLQSKLVIESVELVKRITEPLTWVLFIPRSNINVHAFQRDKDKSMDLGNVITPLGSPFSPFAPSPLADIASFAVSEFDDEKSINYIEST